MWIIHCTRLRGLRSPFTAWLPASKWVQLCVFFLLLCYWAVCKFSTDTVLLPSLFFSISLNMSAQCALCHLPKSLWNLTLAVYAEAYTSPWRQNGVLAKVWWGWWEKKADIWQNNQEQFTWPTFTCLHAVDIYPRHFALPEVAERVRQSWNARRLPRKISGWIQSGRNVLVYIFTSLFTENIGLSTVSLVYITGKKSLNLKD